MLHIDQKGIVEDQRVVKAISPNIERGPMLSIAGLIVHQTGGASAQSSLDSYKNAGANGAHFLIDKDGTIYQTASIKKQTWHTGKLKSRCMFEARCSAAESKLNAKFSPSAENKREMKKSVPDRFPSNQDAVGIELVGEALPRGAAIPEEKKTYEAVSKPQNDSLSWLVKELSLTLRLPLTEVFRHPTVSRKNPSEASTARW
jgi:N-acetyl-anhydromuramyl-L-alanine amidase AmpD